MQASRRGFLKGLIALSAASLAAKLALPSEAMAEEVREGLITDLNKKPVTIFDMGAIKETEPLWYSVSNIREYWAAEIAKEMSRMIDADIMKALTEGAGAPMKQLPKMAGELAKRIDADLATAKVPREKQVYVGLPKWNVIDDIYGKRIQLSAGLSTQATIWGEEYRVEHIRPTELILGGLDKRGAAEFGGLILPS